MSYSCDGTRSGATEKGPEADMFAGSQRSSGKHRMWYRPSRRMLFVDWSDLHKGSKYHTSSRRKHWLQKKEDMCLTQSTRRNPTALTQLVTRTKTKKLNSSHLAETASSQQIPWNHAAPQPPVFCHTPSLPSEHPDDAVSVPVDPKTHNDANPATLSTVA
jgi:hypothetical protein